MISQSGDSPVKRRKSNPPAALIFSIPSVHKEHSYTLYTLRMDSLHCPSWQVDKRYSEFHTLHQTLAAKKRCRVPKFPPKKLLKSQQVIEERREALAKYMNALVIGYNIFADPDVCQFITPVD